MDELLAYFRQVVLEPASATPWAQWWEQNIEQVQELFPLADYVRLKHRRVRGAREILLRAGHLPPEFHPPHPAQTGVCTECGERITADASRPEETQLTCPSCGVLHPPAAG
jgi:hypothetical protein